MDILIGLLLLVVGISVCLSGLRLFFVALPMIGFLIGFFTAAMAVSAVTSEGFLSSVLAMIAGLVLGSILAVMSYVFWFTGALLSTASTGALLGSGAMNGIGVESGWVVTAVAIGVGVVFFIGAFLLALPVYVVIVNTAFIGTGAVVTGLMLVFSQIERAQLSYGIAWAAIESTGLWVVLWGGLFFLGLLIQMRIIPLLTLPEDPWTSARPA